MDLASQGGDSEATVPQPAMLGRGSPEPSASAPTANPPAGTDAEVSSPEREKKPDPKLCGVCGTQPGKYKCPRCSMPYCSVPCNKQHRENHPPDEPKSQQPLPQQQQQPTDPNNNNNNNSSDDSDPYAILLDHRQTFARLFEKYPSLPDELARIQQATLPPPPRSSSSSSGDSNNNPNTGLPLLPGLSNKRSKHQQHQPQRQPVPWSRDVGLRRGAAALRRARTDPTETGDGVREFCELVLFLLAQQEQQRKGGGGLVGRVREEVAAEEMGVIQRLLREERDE